MSQRPQTSEQCRHMSTVHKLSHYRPSTARQLGKSLSIGIVVKEYREAFLGTQPQCQDPMQLEI
eukprot:7916498-Karenia_brevis.AAC.1